MSDVADAAKHGLLDKPERRNKLCVASCFEYSEGRGFRFIRTSITIEHASAGQHDFMSTSLAALRYWMQRIGLSLQKELAVREGGNEFFPTAWLTYNPQYCIQMGRTNLRFLKRLGDGTYVPVDPPTVTFAVY